MRKKQRIFSFIQLFVAVALLTGFDQLTKLLAVKNLKGKAEHSFNSRCAYIFNIWKTEELPLGFSRPENLSGFLLTQPDFSWRLLCLWKIPADKKYIYLKLLCFLITAGASEI